MNTYIMVICVAFVTLATWTTRKVLMSYRRWDNAILLRFKALQADDMPESSVFPVILFDMDYPIMGRSSNLDSFRSKLGILYVKNGHLIIERIGAKDTEPYYHIFTALDRPFGQVHFRTGKPEQTFPGKGSYVIEEVSDESSHNYGGVFLVSPFVALPGDLKDSVTRMRRARNVEGQSKLVAELNRLGM